MTVTRTEIDEAWRACLDGRRRRESVAAWAASLAWSLPAGALVEEIGLQALHRRWSSTIGADGRETPHYLNDRRFRSDYNEWVRACALPDIAAGGTVWVTEEPTTDETYIHRWSGVFHSSWQGNVALGLDAPTLMDINDSLDWARARSERVIVRVGDQNHYSAGGQVLTDLPAWTGDVDLSLRETYSPGEEWRGTYVSGTEIRWEVEVNVSVSSIEPEFQHRAIEVLRQDNAVLWCADLPRRESRRVQRGWDAFTLHLVADSEEGAERQAISIVHAAAAKVLMESGATSTPTARWMIGADARPAPSRS